VVSSGDDEQPVSQLPELVTTPRLRLPLVSPEDAAGMLAGRRRVSWHPDYPRAEDRDAASMVKADDPDAGWGLRHVVRAGDGLTIGSIGFFGAPSVDDDEAAGVPETEVGFGLVADARGHGAVTEALTALLVEVDRLGVRLRASVQPENTAGLRVLAAGGFTQLRGTTEDGELVMVRPPKAPVQEQPEEQS
jgi:ribosomal-protein-alanine N-acetyltransferase